MRFYIMLLACLCFGTIAVESKIVFYSERDGNYEIYTMNSDGTNQTRLTFNDSVDSSPVWSPNGRKIAFESDRDGNTEIYVMDADGKNLLRLTDHAGIDGYPDWSPDGNQIAFSSERGAQQGERKIEIYVMNADGSDVKPVTDLGWALRPRWSPDGEWLVFERGQIYAIRPEGTDLWRVSTPRLKATMILGGWSPDGKQILYTEAVDLNVNTSFPVLATLAPNKRREEVISWKPVKVPRMAFDTATFSADGKSILFAGQKGDAWNIYRFWLADRKLIQLSLNQSDDAAPREWNPRLSVPGQQSLLTQTWGRIKATTVSK